jgi:hypothetical protein
MRPTLDSFHVDHTPGESISKVPQTRFKDINAIFKRYAAVGQHRRLVG